MATMDTISAALKLADAKKSSLRKAFDDLQAVAPSLSSFNLSWSDIDAHFTQIQTHLLQRFKQLETLAAQLPLKSSAVDPSPSSAPPAKITSAVAPGARPELKALCGAMNGVGLMKFLCEHRQERHSIRSEIPEALRCASDPAALVLDTMGGFYPPYSRGDKDPELYTTRMNCILLLEELVTMKLEIGPEVREKAKELAAEWKGKVTRGGENPLEALGFLNLLMTYGLGSEFDVEEFLEFFVITSRYGRAVQLCRVLLTMEKMPNLIEKLISYGKQLLAVKFIFEFQLTDKFPPVPILISYLIDTKKVARKVCKDGNNSLQSLNEATAKQTFALKQVIKCIEDHNLESKYSKEKLERRLEKLEKQKARRNRPKVAAAIKLQQQQPKSQQRNGNKHPWTTAPAVPKNLSGANSTAPHFQQPQLQSAGLLPNRPAPYLTPSAGPYGLVGSAPSAAPYASSSAGLHGFAGTSMGLLGNLSPTRSHLYSSGSHVPSGYYDMPPAYGGYGSQYHPSYYPQ
ncbi:truncated FRIGIDA-like protein 1 [Malania oleifera]|uniref:truncated FRIGIDA-like protein 1 n=1 Tax=Malania oleifera TaxID=397392 RepID=UPI0025AE6658|nr:truncated FRIGIDA-like protein 1 [Malania oleifera]